MSSTFICQGRLVRESDILWLQAWIASHPGLSRTTLAKELCKQWEWTTATGRLKDFAARAYLRKLMERGWITLPPVRTSLQRKHGFAVILPKALDVAPSVFPIEESLSELSPVRLIIPASGSYEEGRFHHYLSTHHYLGFHRTVGENMKYLAVDRHGRDLACVLFGAAAWKIQDRDRYIGWSPAVRAQHLNQVTNNTRFLILPRVRVLHLASHLLGRILRRIRADWEAKYGHGVWLAETFVERDRFSGTCYKAANWKHIGNTRGRSRQDRYNTLSVPIKDIYVYPLASSFRERLCHEDD